VHITHPGDADEPATDYVSERLVYGEDLDAEDARDRNLRGQLWCLYDGAGKVESLQHDYRGQLTEAARRLPKVHVTAPDWDGTAPNEALLLDEVFSTTTVYDALGRVVEAEAPQTTGNTVVNAATTHARRTRYLYHEGGALRGVEARYEGDAAGTWRPYVTDIRYNARGQRMGVDYASGAKTHYDYDPKTFRLTELKHTVVVTETVAGEPTSVTKTAMHCTYTYDPVGNLVQIDDALDAGETRVLAGLADTASKYRYDALYRLVEAIGREHPDNEQPDPTPDGPGNGGLHPNDLTALEGYTESYSYDAVGNFTEMQHAVPAGSGAGWTRVYDYTTDTNRLRRTRAPSEPSGSVDDYGYDAHGNMTRMPHLAEMKWDAYEQMVNVRKGVGSDYIRVRCQYDAQGQRVRKVVEHYNATGGTTPVSVDERLYLGGYEVLREHSGPTVEDDITREVQTLHVMDGEQRVVMVTTRTVDTSIADVTTVYEPDDRQVRTRYQLGNHLGSAAVEVDGEGEVVTYEEYHPYGTCAMLNKRAGTDDEPKRYRFTGMERDETGLQYHTARYYAPSLGRWTSPDPSDLSDGPVGFLYCQGSPIQLRDPNGRNSIPAQYEIADTTPAGETARRFTAREQYGRDQEFIDFDTEEEMTSHPGAHLNLRWSYADSEQWIQGVNGTLLVLPPRADAGRAIQAVREANVQQLRSQLFTLFTCLAGAAAARSANRSVSLPQPTGRARTLPRNVGPRGLRSAERPGVASATPVRRAQPVFRAPTSPSPAATPPAQPGTAVPSGLSLHPPTSYLGSSAARVRRIPRIFTLYGHGQNPHARTAERAANGQFVAGADRFRPTLRQLRELLVNAGWNGRDAVRLSVCWTGVPSPLGSGTEGLIPGQVAADYLGVSVLAPLGTVARVGRGMRIGRTDPSLHAGVRGWQWFEPRR